VCCAVLYSVVLCHAIVRVLRYTCAYYVKELQAGRTCLCGGVGPHVLGCVSTGEVEGYERESLGALAESLRLWSMAPRVCVVMCGDVWSCKSCLS
jgi:hypothetical protein